MYDPLTFSFSPGQLLFNSRRLTNVGLMLGQRRERWASIQPILTQRPEFWVNSRLLQCLFQCLSISPHPSPRTPGCIRICHQVAWYLWLGWGHVLARAGACALSFWPLTWLLRRVPGNWPWSGTNQRRPERVSIHARPHHLTPPPPPPHPTPQTLRFSSSRPPDQLTLQAPKTHKVRN